MKRKLTNTIITFGYSFIVYYFFLPAINLQSIGFWLYLISAFTVWTTCDVIGNFIAKRKAKYTENILSIYAISICIIFLGIIGINLFMSPIFQSKAYANRIKIDQSGEFTEDVKQVDFKSLPLLDKDSSRKVGDRVMGQMPELVSQFYVSNLYTQINYNNEIIRVTPLEYNGLFKYIANYKEGVKGYITVNSVNGKSDLVKLDKGMKYMPSAYLMKDLTRHLRFSYPTKIFGDKYFEIDNDGNPYWITPTLKYTGIELREEVEGVIITNPITGKSKYYKVGNVPTWVDHVYASNLIIEQVNDWGKYRNGYLNSIFGQKNVVMTTEGYNYVVMNDDVYLYTGITSVSSDEANLGFILTNLRTKETRFYSVPGAEEYSAMASAQGQVQQMNYKSTFPLLINLNNRPTYLVSLKDNAGLVKMYGFIDVEDYQKVVVTDAAKGIENAANNYLNNVDLKINENLLVEKQIQIKSIKEAIIEGNTYYYLMDTNNNKYYVSINVNKKKLPFLKVNDIINIKITKQSDVTEIIEVK